MDSMDGMDEADCLSVYRYAIPPFSRSPIHPFGLGQVANLSYFAWRRITMNIERSIFKM